MISSQLHVHVENALMKKISEKYFILATEYSFNISDSPKVKYFTIIFLLKEDIKPDHYPVYIESVFVSDQIENNKVIDVSTMGSVTTFKFEQKGSATLTFNPDAEYEWMYRDSFGGFQGKGKSN
jgi:hypothetical protein